MISNFEFLEQSYLIFLKNKRLLYFQNGGLQRLISALPPGLATSETTFVMKRQQLLELKRKIGAISKKCDYLKFGFQKPPGTQ